MNSASIRASLFKHTGAISCTVLICSKRFSILGWPFVRFEHLSRGERSIVGEQRVHVVALLIVGDGRLVQGPLDIVAPARDPAVRRVGSGTSATRLLVAVGVAHRALDLEVAPDAIMLKDLHHLQIDLGGPTQPRPGAGEPRAQCLELFGCRGDIAVPPGVVVQAE